MSAITTTEKRSNDEQHCRQQQLHSIAWDPSNPSALLIVSSDKDNASNSDTNGSDMIMECNDANHQNIQFHTWFSETGNVGGILSSHELTALLRFVSDYEIRMQQQQAVLVPFDQNMMNRKISYREQSQRYRNIISDLLMEFESHHDVDDKNDPTSAQLLHPTESELLHQINSILYLSEIYLLPPPSPSITSTIGGNTLLSKDEPPENRSYLYSDGTIRNWFDCPGIATADTVRFLRQFVLPPPPPSSFAAKSRGRNVNDNDDRMDDDDDDHDDHDHDDDNHPYDNFGDFPNDDEYWELVFLSCKCGYLHLVWKLLQTHRWYVTAMNQLQQYENEDDTDGGSSNMNNNNHAANDPSIRATVQAVINEWEQIGSVLLTAPIPGGRCRSTTTERDDDVDDTLLTDNDIDLTYVDGLNVLPTDFQHWEIPSSSLSPDYTTNDRPITYIPDIAIQKHQLWSGYVKHVRSHNRLCKKIPYIDTLMQLLSGDYGSMKHRRYNNDAMIGRKTSQPDNNGHPLFSSWPEQLCCELLYRSPDLRPRTIASRTAVIMKSYNIENNENTMHSNRDGSIISYQPPEQRSSLFAYEASIVAIMQGNAGRTISELYDLGGESGAAVPMTLMTLVFDLFVEAQIIPQESVEKRFEFLIESSSSIVASTHVSHPDIGVQLAIRLLLPHITMLTSSVRNEFAAAVSNILEHYTPTTDHYARTALSLCIPLLSKTKQKAKNTQRQWQRVLLDGCVSVYIQLYRKHEQQCNIEHTEKFMQVLLEGVDLECDVLSQPWLGTCYRLLEAECYKAVVALLQAMASESTRNKAATDDLQQSDHLKVVKAEPMSRVIGRYLSTHSSKINGFTKLSCNHLPNVALHLVDVADMFTLYLVDKHHNEQAKHIIAFLSNYSSASSSSSIQLRWWMLRVARSLIKPNIDGIFDLNDVRILLQHLSEVTSCPEIISMGSKNKIVLPAGSVSEQNDLQLCFHGLLLKTLCTQNSLKQISCTKNLLRSESSGPFDVRTNKCAQANDYIITAMLH